MLSKKTLAATVAVSLVATASAHAADGFSWRFSGFGTAGYAATSTNDLRLLNPGQLKGASKNGSGLVDSRVGGQLDLTFGPKLSATVQAIAMQDAKGDFTPQVEWAFLRYKPSGSTTLRVGRLGWPAYLVSDYRYVGFANPWVRAPLEVYSLAPLDNYEGADLSWSHDAGGGYLTVQGLFGHASSPLPYSAESNARLKVNQLAGAYLTYEIGSLRLRGGASTGKVSYRADNVAQLLGALRLTGFDRTADAITTDGARTTFASLGGTYDDGQLLATAEYAKLSSASEVLGHAYGWYGTVGYHLGKFTPYVSWAGYGKRDERASYAIPAAGSLLPLAAGVDRLIAGNGQHTASLGLRADVHGNVAVKAQVDRVLPTRRGGTFSVVDPGYRGQAANVYSVVVDFVF